MMTDELTNLNWLCSITTAKSCSPLANGLNTTQTQQRDKPRLKVLLPSGITTPQATTSQRKSYHESTTNGSRQYPVVITSKGYYSRPSCSYSCLIAMALKASSTGCLPVHEIYRFVEQEYPFYKTAPEGWKNSIRHNLSMNQNFIKVQRPDGFQTKKGYYWAANPTRQHVLDLEIERALKTMGRDLIENSAVKQLVYHTSMDVNVVPNSSTDISEEEQDGSTPSLPDVLTGITPTTDSSNLEGFNLIADIKTQNGKHFPILIKRESSVFHLCTIKSDNDALMELFGTSFFNPPSNEEGKTSIKLISAETKRQCSFLPSSLSYLPLSKTTALQQQFNKVSTNNDDTPDCIKPYFYKSHDINERMEEEEGEEECKELSCDLQEQDEEEDSFIVEDEELCEVLKSCSPESDVLLNEEECEEEKESTVCMMTEDEGYLVLDKRLLESDEISDICQELYEENPSIFARLPDVSSQEKAMEFLTYPSSSSKEEPSLPLLELDQSEWPTGDDEIITVLKDSDTKDIDF